MTTAAKKGAKSLATDILDFMEAAKAPRLAAPAALALIARWNTEMASATRLLTDKEASALQVLVSKNKRDPLPENMFENVATMAGLCAASKASSSLAAPVQALVEYLLKNVPQLRNQVRVYLTSALCRARPGFQWLLQRALVVNALDADMLGVLTRDAASTMALLTACSSLPKTEGLRKSIGTLLLTVVSSNRTNLGRHHDKLVSTILSTQNFPILHSEYKALDTYERLKCFVRCAAMTEYPNLSTVLQTQPKQLSLLLKTVDCLPSEGIITAHDHSIALEILGALSKLPNPLPSFLTLHSSLTAATATASQSNVSKALLLHLPPAFSISTLDNWAKRVLDNPAEAMSKPPEAGVSGYLMVLAVHILKHRSMAMLVSKEYSSVSVQQALQTTLQVCYSRDKPVSSAELRMALPLLLFFDGIGMDWDVETMTAPHVLENLPGLLRGSRDPNELFGVGGMEVPGWLGMGADAATTSRLSLLQRCIVWSACNAKHSICLVSKAALKAVGFSISKATSKAGLDTLHTWVRDRTQQQTLAELLNIAWIEREDASAVAVLGMDDACPLDRSKFPTVEGDWAVATDTDTGAHPAYVCVCEAHQEDVLLSAYIVTDGTNARPLDTIPDTITRNINDLISAARERLVCLCHQQLKHTYIADSFKNPAHSLVFVVTDGSVSGASLVDFSTSGSTTIDIICSNGSWASKLLEPSRDKPLPCSGKCLLNTIQIHKPNSMILLKAVQSAVSFYVGLGFYPSGDALPLPDNLVPMVRLWSMEQEAMVQGRDALVHLEVKTLSGLAHHLHSRVAVVPPPTD